MTPDQRKRVDTACDLLLSAAQDPYGLGVLLARFLPEVGITDRGAQLGTIEEVGELVIPEYTARDGRLQPWVRVHLQELVRGSNFIEPRIAAAFVTRIALSSALITLAKAGT